MLHSREEIQPIFDLSGKIAIVTGSGSGIGLAISYGYAAMGAHVILVDVNPEALKPLPEQFAEYGYEIETAVCDISDTAAIDELFGSIIDRHGQIDILVNCAAITTGKPAEQHTAEEFKRILEVNVLGTFNCCLAASRSMIPRKKGKIINIGSVRGNVGSYVGHVAYGSSKGAVHMMTKQLATEWAKYNINVNCIVPNLTNTSMAQYLIQNKPVYEQYLSRIPMRRLAETDDYLGLAIYLASEASNFISGQLIDVDGGSHAG